MSKLSVAMIVTLDSEHTTTRSSTKNSLWQPVNAFDATRLIYILLKALFTSVQDKEYCLISCYPFLVSHMRWTESFAVLLYCTFEKSMTLVTPVSSISHPETSVNRLYLDSFYGQCFKIFQFLTNKGYWSMKQLMYFNSDCKSFLF